MPTALAFLAEVQSVFAENDWVIAFVVAALVLAGIKLWPTVFRSNFVESMQLRLSVPRKLECARVSGSLALLLASGHTLQSAMTVAHTTAKFSRTRRELAKAENAMIEGKAFSAAIADVFIFDSDHHQMLGVGELSNQLQQMLQHIERTCRETAFEQIERYVSLLTPIATLLMGGLIGGLMMTVMQAILQIDGIVR